MIKPDGVSRGLEKEIFKRIEQAGLKVINKKKLSVTREQAAELYSPHLGKKFYPGLLNFITYTYSRSIKNIIIIKIISYPNN